MIRRLLHRGWSYEEIIDLHNRPYRPNKEHRLVVVFSFIVLAAVAITIPFAYGVFAGILTSLLFYFILGVFALCFGAVLGLLFSDLERLDHKHHIVLLFVLPILLFASAHWFMSQGFAYAQGVFAHNALIGGLVYACLFTITYAFMVAKEWNLRIGQ